MTFEGTEGYLKAIVTLRGEHSPSIEGFVLKYGKRYQAQALPKGIQRGEPKCCFGNAWALARTHPELLYVKGYATNLITMLHAWCCEPKGRVIDPTWQNPEKCDYYGIAFRTDFVRPYFRNRKYWGILARWDLDYPVVLGVIKPEAWMPVNGKESKHE